MKLTGIELENLKSHKKNRFSLKPLTILIGPNSCGKSSILQSLLMLKNTLHPKNTAVSEQLATQTESYDFGRLNDIITNGDPSKKLSITISGTKEIVPGFHHDRKGYSNYNYKAIFNKNGNVGINFSFRVDNFSITFDWITGDNPIGIVKDFSTDETFEVNRAEVSGINPRLGLNTKNPKLLRFFQRFFANGDYTKELLDDLYYVPFNRTATTYGANLTRPTDDLISTNIQHMMSFMLSKLSREPKLLDKVSEFIYDISGKSIRTRNVDMTNSTDQGVTIDFVKKHSSNSIVNEGTGLNQIVLLLTVLASVPKDSIIVVDEPEIHLHPSAQSKLTKIIIDLVKTQSKQIIFTTHSEHMIYPILANIANKNDNSLSTSDVVIYYLSQDEETNLTNYEELRINDKGQLEGGLKGFWDADLKAFSEFLEVEDD